MQTIALLGLLSSRQNFFATKLSRLLLHDSKHSSSHTDNVSSGVSGVSDGSNGVIACKKRDRCQFSEEIAR